MNFPYQIIELELEQIEMKNHTEPFLRVYGDRYAKKRHGTAVLRRSFLFYCLKRADRDRGLTVSESNVALPDEAFRLHGINQSVADDEKVLAHGLDIGCQPVLGRRVHAAPGNRRHLRRNKMT